MIQHDIIPSRIKQARVSRGYSMADLGNLVGVSRQAISKYEIGTYTPTEAVLSRIASVLRYEISFFRFHLMLLLQVLYSFGVGVQLQKNQKKLQRKR